MKIDHNASAATSLRLPSRSRAAAPASQPAAVKTQDGAAAVRAFPERADGSFDAEKVAAIREEIRAGRYRINPDRIADGMLASLRELLPGGKA